MLQGATGIRLPGTGTDTAYKGQCVTGVLPWETFFPDGSLFSTRLTARFTKITSHCGQPIFNLLENAIENELKRVFVFWPS